MKLILTPFLLIFCLSTIAQNNWTEIETNTHKKLNTISFGSTSVGYIGGNDSLLLKTTDGGQTWAEVEYTGVQFFPEGEAIINLKFLDEEVGFMTIGPYTGTYKTTDGGNSWTLLSTADDMCYNQGLFFWNENNGLIGGAGCFQGEKIEMYNNGEFTPTNINTPSWTAEDLVLDIDFFDEDFGLAVSPSRFLRTINGGQNWDTIPSITYNQLTSIEVVNDTLAYAGYIDDQSSGFGLLRTHDGGLTWGTVSEMATFAYPDYNDVHETSNGYLFAVGKSGFGNEGMIFDNTGEGWWFEYTSKPLNAMGSYGENTVFAVGDSGLVVTNAEFEVNVLEQKSEIQLLLIYPNPVQNEINFELSGKSLRSPSKVLIRNLKGQLVFEGTVSDAKVDVSSLKSGSYFLEVQSEGRRFSRQFVK